MPPQDLDTLAGVQTLGILIAVLSPFCGIAAICVMIPPGKSGAIIATIYALVKSAI